MGKLGKFDIKGLDKFQKQIDQLQESQFNAFLIGCAKELAARLLAKVIKRTPVGVYDKPVHFTTDDGKEVSFTPHTGKKGGTLRRGWTIGAIVKTGGVYTIEVINPILYASYIEYGHRTPNHKGWVDGHFMLTISEQELEADAPGVIERKLQNFLKQIFK